MDAHDRKILALVQQTGRVAAHRLSEVLGISGTASHRRLRRLENSRVIRGYRADLDPAALGLRFEVAVQVDLQDVGPSVRESFERAVAAIRFVAQASRLAGSPDYLLHVLAPDRASFRVLHDHSLSRLPGVREMRWVEIEKHLREGYIIPTDPWPTIRPGPTT